VTNDDQKVAKVAFLFSCNICNYNCNKKYNLTKHLSTVKHKNMLLNDLKMTNDDHKIAKVANKTYECHCGNKYKYKQGLSRHKKTCQGEKKVNDIIQTENKDEMKELVFKLIQQNNDLQKTIS